MGDPPAAQDAVDVFVALGWPITPHGPDMEFWRIGDLIWTDADVMGLAARHGVQVLTGAGQALTAPLQ